MITLKAGAWSARVYPECGMNLTALECDGEPIFRTPADEETLRGCPFLYGNPLLLPANRTENGKFTFKDKVYTLPLSEPLRGNNLHGMMADAPFEVVRQSENEVTAVYRNRGERYPFAFDITITDRLSESGWCRKVRLAAKEDMPYTLAFHSTFVQPEEFSVPIGRRHLCNENYIPIGETVEPEPLGKVISGFYRATGKSAMVGNYVFTVSELFDQWVLFNGGGEQGFLCIEPQCGEVNGLNTDAHQTLGAGESAEFALTIEKRTP